MDDSLYLSPNAPTTTNANGGKQSSLPWRFDLLDPASMFAQAKVLAEGAEKYGENNWKQIPTRDHLNHLIVHAYAALAGDTSDDHYSHMMCRAMFAFSTHAEDLKAVTDKQHEAGGDGALEHGNEVKKLWLVTKHDGQDFRFEILPPGAPIEKLVGCSCEITLTRHASSCKYLKNVAVECMKTLGLNHKKEIKLFTQVWDSWVV